MVSGEHDRCQSHTCWYKYCRRNDRLELVEAAIAGRWITAKHRRKHDQFNDIRHSNKASQLFTRSMKESRNKIEETNEGNFKQYDYLQAWSHDLDFLTALVGI